MKPIVRRVKLGAWPLSKALALFAVHSNCLDVHTLAACTVRDIVFLEVEAP